MRQGQLRKRYCEKIAIKYIWYSARDFTEGKSFGGQSWFNDQISSKHYVSQIKCNAHIVLLCLKSIMCVIVLITHKGPHLFWAWHWKCWKWHNNFWLVSDCTAVVDPGGGATGPHPKFFFGPTMFFCFFVCLLFVSRFLLKLPWRDGSWMGDYAIVVAAILRTPRELHVCSNVMIGEYPVWTRLVC